MTPLEIITLRAPTFAADPRVNDMITLAGEGVGTVFGSRRNEAIALLVMHQLSIDSNTNGGQTGIVGSVTSEKEGQLSRSYGFSGTWNIKDPYWAQSSFGLELMNLRKATIFGPRTRTMD